MRGNSSVIDNDKLFLFRKMLDSTMTGRLLGMCNIVLRMCILMNYRYKSNKSLVVRTKPDTPSGFQGGHTVSCRACNSLVELGTGRIQSKGHQAARTSTKSMLIRAFP